MPNPTLSQAIREAYAHCPSDVVILHTLELRHPHFIDGRGQKTAIRVVRDHQDLNARLEPSAPLQGGEIVHFVALGFDLSLPPLDTTPVPEMLLSLDNVSRLMMQHLDQAVMSAHTIEVTYRPYLSNDLEGPQMDPPLTLVLSDVDADILRITGRCRMLDIGNVPFPNVSYTAKTFPGLIR